MTQLQQKYGADNSIYDVNERPHLDYSRFDFSRKTNTTLDIGTVVPIDWFRVFPGDKITVSNRYILDTLPLVNTPFTNYRIRIHWYGIELSGLAKGWQSFISQGRKGTVQVKQLPVLKESAFAGKALPCSLACYLGLPVMQGSKTAGFDYTQPVADPSTVEQIPNRHLPYDGVVPLPFLFYQKIWRFGICPQNLLQDNEVWYPEDLSEEWRLNYLATNMNEKGFFVPQGVPPETPVSHAVPSVTDTAVDLLQLRYACFDRDYFTEAKPWLVRGNELSSVNMDVSIAGTIDFSDVFSGNIPGKVTKDKNYSFPIFKTDAVARDISSSATLAGIEFNDFSGAYSATELTAAEAGVGYKNFLNAFNRARISSDASAKAQLTANALRSMLAFSVWQERNALTSGNYNEFIKAHFNENPKKPDYEPTFLGGLSAMVNFSNVLQTSAPESASSSPLGTQAGLGGASNQGQVFNFVSKNYGYVMGVMFITPEIYYTQGVGHEWTDKLPEDWFMPEFARTGYEPILNQEIYPQNSEDDLKLFGYQTRNSYLKARQNRASGMFALPAEFDLLFSSYVQAREFNGLPKLSLQFASCSPENIRRDFLAYTKYPAFKLQIATDVKLVRALPYASTPETFGF